MNERLKEFLKQQIQTCEVALSKSPSNLQREFWEGKMLAYILVQSEGWNNF